MRVNEASIYRGVGRGRRNNWHARVGVGGRGGSAVSAGVFPTRTRRRAATTGWSASFAGRARRSTSPTTRSASPRWNATARCQWPRRRKRHRTAARARGAVGSIDRPRDPCVNRVGARTADDGRRRARRGLPAARSRAPDRRLPDDPAALRRRPSSAWPTSWPTGRGRDARSPRRSAPTPTGSPACCAGSCSRTCSPRTADGRFALTALGEGLRDGVPGSLRGAVLARGELYWSAAGGLLRAVTEGGTAFEHVHGERVLRPPRRRPGARGGLPGLDGRPRAARGRRRRGGLRLRRAGGARRRRRWLGRPARGDPARDARAARRPRRPAGGGRSAPARGWRPPGWRTAASAWSATSSPRCRRAPTPTCSRACSTTGTTTTRGGSSRPAARRCPRRAPAASSRRSCPSARTTAPRRCGWTSTC